MAPTGKHQMFTRNVPFKDQRIKIMHIDHRTQPCDWRKQCGLLDSALKHPKERRLVSDCSQKAAQRAPCLRGATTAQAREGAAPQKPDKGRLLVPGASLISSSRENLKALRGTEEKGGISSSDPVKPLKAPCVESHHKEVQVPLTQHPQGLPLWACSYIAAQGHCGLLEAARLHHGCQLPHSAMF